MYTLGHLVRPTVKFQVKSSGSVHLMKVLKELPSYCNVNSAQSYADETNTKGKGKSVKPILPEEPTNCCLSGCANCVWIEYAQELIEIFGDGGDKAKEKIMEHVKDPSLKAFLLMELQTLVNTKKT